jgi:glucose-1-phosphate thymidylyltransferase
MKYIKDAKQICLERDANRCRHCGTTEDLSVSQLVSRDGRLAWQLSNLITLCKECDTLSLLNMANKRKNRVGVILCGGKGTRLYPLTKFQNKHTLPIGLTPMLFYPLKTLRKFGVYRVLVVIDRDGADEIIGMLGSGKEFGMDISYKIQEGAGGISEALYLAKDFVKPDEEIVCILGDNIFDNDSLDPNFTLEPENLACVFVKEVSNPQDYGVAVIEDGFVTKIVEKPKEFISNLGVVGLYVFTDDVFEVIEGTKPSDRGELEISSVNNFFASAEVLQYQEVKGYWGDAGGSIQRYAECNMHGAKEANVSAEEIDSFRSIVFDDK